MTWIFPYQFCCLRKWQKDTDRKRKFYLHNVCCLIKVLFLFSFHWFWKQDSAGNQRHVESFTISSSNFQASSKIKFIMEIASKTSTRPQISSFKWVCFEIFLAFGNFPSDSCNFCGENSLLWLVQTLGFWASQNINFVAISL